MDLKPVFIAALGYAKGEMETVRGKIEAEWIFENEQFIYTVTLPDGISATFNGKTLEKGRNIFYISNKSEE